MQMEKPAPNAREVQKRMKMLLAWRKQLFGDSPKGTIVPPQAQAVEKQGPSVKGLCALLPPDADCPPSLRAERDALRSGLDELLREDEAVRRERLSLGERLEAWEAKARAAVTGTDSEDLDDPFTGSALPQI